MFVCYSCYVVLMYSNFFNLLFYFNKRMYYFYKHYVHYIIFISFKVILKLYCNFILIAEKTYFPFLCQPMQKEASLYYLYFHLTLSSAVSEITICWHFAIVLSDIYLESNMDFFHLFAWILMTSVQNTLKKSK